MADLRARRLVQLAAVLALGLASTACSTMSDIGDSVASMDPTGLLGGETADNAPDLANIPAAPANSTDQAQVASNVNAAGSQAQYSADALRAGTEAAAPPPSPGEAAPSPMQQALAAPAPSAADTAPSAAPSASDAPPSAAPSAADAPPTADAAPPPSASPAPSADAAVPANTPVRTASASPVASALPSGGEPAVPPLAAGSVLRGGMTAPVMSDAALGFKPSSAPPLNPSINQWVSQPILNNYRRTASLSRVASLDAAVPAADGDMTPVSAIGGVPPTATVFFPGDGTSLSAAGRAQVRAAVAAFKAQGGTGSLRVVGHASSRTANMPVEKHLELIFAKSQSRANAVAQELIHDGVPAAQVIVEAVGDIQPVYYESMPKGEDGNRRAEIFLQ